MSLRLRYYGDKILREKTFEVTEFSEELSQWATEMEQLMLKARGTGLAAPQVGLNKKFFIARFSPENKEICYEEWLKLPLYVFVNPKISNLSKKSANDIEGCLSLPGLKGSLSRPLSLKVEAQDLKGDSFSMELNGLAARIILHENDHLNGILFFDRMKGTDKNRFKNSLKQAIKSRDEYKQPALFSN